MLLLGVTPPLSRIVNTVIFVNIDNASSHRDICYICLYSVFIYVLCIVYGYVCIYGLCFDWPVLPVSLSGVCYSVRNGSFSLFLLCFHYGVRLNTGHIAGFFALFSLRVLPFLVVIVFNPFSLLLASI